MSDFRDHHKIPNHIPPPQGNVLPHKLFSYIVDMMAYSMGAQKRNELMKELEEYKQGLPFDMR